jgi:RNA polymerase sigma factor (sigma-70 family)
MFPTTVWTRIGEAGALDAEALDEFATRYRPAVVEYLGRRGFRGAAADDLCQEVFLRLLRGDVLAKADRGRGRFRSLLATVTMRVIQDGYRRRTDRPTADLDPGDASGARDSAFDHAWALHLADRALEALREQGSPYYDVLVDHLAGRPQDRNRLWIARRKLGGLIRHEIAVTCTSQAEFDEEVALLAPYLRPPTESSRKI